MHLKLPVGEKEKHVVMIDYDMFTSKVLLYIDDELQKTFVLTGNPLRTDFTVGDVEKHNISIYIRGKTIPVVTIYVDDNLIGTFR
ncbi:MAG: hypothetical protein QXO98_02080 [Sulfolobales archaeon]